VPQESLTDSPPNEFNFFDDDEDRTVYQPMNFIESTPEHSSKNLTTKHGNDKDLVDAFASTILHILEIKCSDPQVITHHCQFSNYSSLSL
jgi:hypothetical protein